MVGHGSPITTPDAMAVACSRLACDCLFTPAMEQQLHFDFGTMWCYRLAKPNNSQQKIYHPRRKCRQTQSTYEKGLAFCLACTRVSHDDGLENKGMLSACCAVGRCKPIRPDGKLAALAVHLPSAPRLVKVAHRWLPLHQFRADEDHHGAELPS